MNITGKSTVVTGKIPGHTRVTAEQALIDRGAQVQRSVTRDTDLLVCGQSVGATKTNRASELGVQVVLWDEVMNGDGPVGPVTVISDEGVSQADIEGNTVTLRHTKKSDAAPVVRQVQPMLAKGADKAPQGDGWRHEIKWDGFRCIAHCGDGDVVTLMSRSGKPFDFPQIADELKAFSGMLFDGEVVLLTESETSGHFQALGNGNPAAQYVVFDVLEIGGIDVRDRPWSERREMLERIIELIDSATFVGLSPVSADGEQLLERAVENGWEGIVSKRVSSRYNEGARNDNWLKIKIRHEQEFVVCGYSMGGGRMEGNLGALLLGYYDDGGELHCAGAVGTGWHEGEARRLLTELQALEQVERDRKKWGNGETVFVEVAMVVQASFQRWTSGDEGALWHPSYGGQRHDKAAADVRRES